MAALPGVSDDQSILEPDHLRMSSRVGRGATWNILTKGPIYRPTKRTTTLVRTKQWTSSLWNS